MEHASSNRELGSNCGYSKNNFSGQRNVLINGTKVESSEPFFKVSAFVLCYFLKQLLKTEENSWSLAELIHAVVLLTHYHSLASFTFGCGISPEIDCEGGHTFRPPSVSNYCLCDITNGYHGVDDIHASPAASIPVSVCLNKQPLSVAVVSL